MSKTYTPEEVANMVSDATAKAFASGYGQGKKEGRRTMLKEVLLLLNQWPKLVESLKSVYKREI